MAVTPTGGADLKDGGRPIRFSIVSAVYNVAKFLPDYIASIEHQTFPLDQVEVFVVDDGSTDDSLTILKEWQARRPGLVTVLSQENAGQGAARNAGMADARGEWVTFIDPDDVIEPDYLANVDRFIKKNAVATMVATNRIYLEEKTGELRDGHPLRRMFRGADRLVDLERFPDYFHGSAPTGFFRNELLREHQVRFDPRVRPNFEDGHFSCLYLLAAPNVLVGFVGSARYHYRRRGDGTSTLQNSLRDPSRFNSVPKYGYLDALKRGAVGREYPPEWLQNFVLYEISWYFSSDAAMGGAATAARGEVAREFLATLREIAKAIDPVVIESFSIRRFDRPWRLIMLHGFDEQPWHTPYLVMQKLDADKSEVQLAYYFTGELPEETVLVRGQQVPPVAAKTRGHTYFEHTLLNERILWVPAGGTLRVLINGRPTPLLGEWPENPITSMRPARIGRIFEERRNGPERHVRKRTFFDKAFATAARSLPMRLRYGKAWVLMDRIDDCGDNGERLFVYLREHRRDIDAWFVIERGTPDWRRLRRERRRRVVAHGSLRWKLLMLNCKNYVSSHIDAPVQAPPKIMELADPEWKFSFLQHGVIKDDISRWLNAKQIDLFVTSSPAEHESIVSDGSPYVFTDKEVKMVGLARFDRLREIAAATPMDERRLVLVAPTWRHWLNVPKEPGSHVRQVTDDFLASEYAQMWLGLLGDEELRRLAEAEGLQLGFLPHPNIQPVLNSLSLPKHVRALRYADVDVQKLVAQSAVMISDYSSMVFNAAYVERPVIYFQFDHDTFHSGGHLGREGYFDYERDGFGPVTTTVEQTVAAIRDAVLTFGRSPAPIYLDRIQTAFPVRDGRCCERTVAAIEDLSKPAR